ncbi:PAS domain S-box protein [Archaeoglobus veneficus]|uniref:Transcriptional regulator, MarR family n=1 Tax=Archaeoglobus veneficus (strain DSM 11195 / SNP6) TaxID=693661 RepID=F2KMJ4_ARCVS|nr:PAS domain S-box protein [Archaeoglobus veneficus]AEA47191.1 transcriptional regulator, MarR family [Archaeoglobus veneficus SNP6]
MRLPIFFKIVAIALFFALLSLALFTVTSNEPSGLTYVYYIYMFIIILGISFFVAGSITEPLERLRKGFENIMRGESAHIEVDTGDELEDLAKAFNYMVDVLTKQKDMLKRSEDKYRSLIEDVNDWVFEVDENFVYTYSSPKVRDILGYEPEEVVGKKPFDFMPEDERKKAVEEFENIKGDKIPFCGLENVFLRKDGSPVILETCGRPFFDEKGNLRGYRAVSRDVTARKQAEEKLAYLASITDHTVDAVVSLDLDSRIVSWNKGAEMMFGYKESEVIGKPLATLMPKENWDSCRENFKKAILEGYARDIETVRITKDGRRILVDQTLTTIYDSNGEHMGFVAIMRDITKRKEAEEELKRAYRQLEEKTQELLKSQKELEYLANILENSNDAIYSVNLEGVITSWNKTAEKLFGWTKKEALGMSADVLLPDEIKNEIPFLIQKIKEGVRFISYETRRLTKDGEIIDVDVTVSPILDEEGKPTGFSVIARDITSKIKAEESMLKRILKFDIDKGKVYLIEESFPDLALEVFNDLIKCGYSGTIITRRLPDEIKVENNSTHFWLSEKKGKNTLSPDISEIETTIMNLPNWNNAVLLELDYVILKNGFDKTFEFIQRLKEVFYILKKGVVLLSLDPDILNEKQIKLLRKECSTIKLKPKHHDLPPEVYEILRYVYMQNRVGERPSVKDIMSKFNIARNTAKKRIRYLEENGLLKVIRDGRLKVVEVTEKGRELFYIS